MENNSLPPNGGPMNPRKAVAAARHASSSDRGASTLGSGADPDRARSAPRARFDVVGQVIRVLDRLFRIFPA